MGEYSSEYSSSSSLGISSFSGEIINLSVHGVYSGDDSSLGNLSSTTGVAVFRTDCGVS